MDLALAVAFFAGSMAYFLYAGYPMLCGVVVGFISFVITALNRGFRLKDVLVMASRGAAETLVVVKILILIGMMTGLWRAGGTFAILVAWGMRLIRPSLFVLMAYLITAVVSYAIGTSFGVAGTAGLALMMLGRSAGVNPAVVAGAIMSGIYFGDRGSPASSCAALVAAVTGTQVYDNVRFMLKTAFPAVLVTVAFYAFLSFVNPMTGGSISIVEDLESCFNLHPAAVCPALCMMVLPLIGVRPFHAFFISIAFAFGCTVFLQGFSVYGALHAALLGFTGQSGTAAELFNGGGVISMASLCMILIVSGTFSGIFEGTGMLNSIRSEVKCVINRYGAFTAALVTGIFTNGIFCNQTIGVMLAQQLLGVPYRETGHSADELVQDIENSVVIVAGLIPWCLACFVPITMIEAGYDALPYAFYLYALPVTYALTKKFWFR